MADKKSVNLDSLLCSKSRDFLVHSNGDHVEVKNLNGKTVGLYFSASWCPPCRKFTPILTKVYEQLLSSNSDLEIVFISSDRDQESHEGYFSKMPWLAIPFSDNAIERVESRFNVSGIPCLVFVDGAGNVLSTEGVTLVQDYGPKAYPFTPEAMEKLKRKNVSGRQTQSLRSLLVSDSRDFLVSNDDKKVPVSEIEGKMVGLFLTLGGAAFPGFHEFTKKLVDMYNQLREKGEDFEIVMINLHVKEKDFNEAFARMPWLTVPLEDTATSKKLEKYFKLEAFQRLVVIEPNGKTLNPDATEAVLEYGIQAFPFTPDKLVQAKMAKLQLQSLESLFVTEDGDFVIYKTGRKVPISKLVGKHVLIYFSAHWCPPCQSFTPQLVKAYLDIRAKERSFEIIFVSNDKDQASFDKYFSTMPWLAVPFDDQRTWLLYNRIFKLNGIPTLVAIGPNGRTITSNAVELIETYGADAFPFTDDHIQSLKEKNAKMGSKKGYICEGDVCRKV